MRYQNKRNGKIAKVVKRDEKCMTVLLQYEDGTSTCISNSTFKRWWKLLEEEVEVEAQLKEIPGEAVEPVKKEIVKEKRDSATELKIKFSSITDIANKLVTDFGGSMHIRKSQTNIVNYKLNNYIAFSIKFSSKAGVILCTKSKYLTEDLLYNFDENNHFSFNRKFLIPDTSDETKRLVIDIINKIYENSKKEEK